jgi:hypothetical protein
MEGIVAEPVDANEEALARLHRVWMQDSEKDALRRAKGACPPLVTACTHARV